MNVSTTPEWNSKLMVVDTWQPAALMEQLSSPTEQESPMSLSTTAFVFQDSTEDTVRQQFEQECGVYSRWTIGNVEVVTPLAAHTRVWVASAALSNALHTTGIADDVRNQCVYAYNGLSPYVLHHAKSHTIAIVSFASHAKPKPFTIASKRHKRGVQAVNYVLQSDVVVHAFVTVTAKRAVKQWARGETPVAPRQWQRGMKPAPERWMRGVTPHTCGSRMQPHWQKY